MANRNGQATTIATRGANQARTKATTRAMAANAATASGRSRTGDRAGTGPGAVGLSVEVTSPR